jgi:hypothetical protein
VVTYNGVVTLRSQEQARRFGRKLYQHLSKGGKVLVTSDLLRNLLDERLETVQHDDSLRRQHDRELANITSSDGQSTIVSYCWNHLPLAFLGTHTGCVLLQGGGKDLANMAVAMFDPFALGRISESNCIDAVVNIYKEQRFTAASLNDFSELHQSVRYMIEILYWIIMVFILQYAFGIDVTSYILPFVTLLLAISFAISSLVGNIFLAFAFVFFMQPYDVGQQVQIGLFNAFTPPVAGTVKNITLLYTVITTGKNETVRRHVVALCAARCVLRLRAEWCVLWVRVQRAEWLPVLRTKGI